MALSSFKLSKAAAIEDKIDAQLLEQCGQNRGLMVFSINLAALSEAVKGFTARELSVAIKRYVKVGWQVVTDKDTITLAPSLAEKWYGNRLQEQTEDNPGAGITCQGARNRLDHERTK